MSYYFDSGCIYSSKNMHDPIDEDDVTERLEQLDRIREMIHGEDTTDIILGIAEILGENISV